jgi:hypothetical protein
LAALDGQATSSRELKDDGALLRVMTTEDALLLARIEKNRVRAYEACVKLLEQRAIPAVLMDVEHLF